MSLSDAVRAYLQKPVIVRMAVQDSNGYPHIVPVWFILDGDDLLVFGSRGTKKVAYMLANPKGSIQVGGDPPGEGYLLKGEFSLEEDHDNYYWSRKITLAYEKDQATADKLMEEWIPSDLVVLRLKVHQVIKV